MNAPRRPLFNPSEYQQKITLEYPPYGGWNVPGKPDKNSNIFWSLKVNHGGQDKTWLIYEGEMQILGPMGLKGGDDLMVAKGPAGQLEVSISNGGSTPQQRAGAGTGAVGAQRLSVYMHYYKLAEYLGVAVGDRAAFSATMFIDWQREGPWELPSVTDMEGREEVNDDSVSF